MTTPLDRARAQFSGKKVLIFGLGLLGGAAGDAKFFSELGAKIAATDLKSPAELASTLSTLKDLSIDFHLGGHLESDIRETDYILRNPSVPLNHPLLNLARELNKPILMRSSLFASLSGVKIVGITGTRGKTTTTTMIHHLLQHHLNQKILLGGNIQGVSDLNLLAQITDPKHTIAVMELSSWQLQGFKESQISPSVSVVTNLYPDHLNRYENLNAYYLDKKAILDFQHPEDIAILNDKQPELHDWAQTTPGQIIWFNSRHLPTDFSLSIPGNHNRENASAALAVASVFNIDRNQALDTLSRFKGVQYRLETVGNHNGITYINDTTATTPVATIAAINSLDQKPIILVGGADKLLPIEDLAKTLNSQTRKIVLFAGSGTDKLIPLLDQNLIVDTVKSMEAAVSLATAKANPGDIILLSPGFASFGIFVNEFDRGDQFNQCVQNLK